MQTNKRLRFELNQRELRLGVLHLNICRMNELRLALQQGVNVDDSYRLLLERIEFANEVANRPFEGGGVPVAGINPAPVPMNEYYFGNGNNWAQYQAPEPNPPQAVPVFGQQGGWYAEPNPVPGIQR